MVLDETEYVLVQLRVLAVGKIKEAYLREGIEEYLKRLRTYARVEVVPVREEPYRNNFSATQKEQVIEREADSLLKASSAAGYTIALDSRGQMLSSEALADLLAELQVRGTSVVQFVIGGSLGLSPRVRQAADLIWSLGPATFPHALVRLLLLEQIYRAFTIIKGEPYHK